jgi:hypothetical protein
MEKATALMGLNHIHYPQIGDVSVHFTRHASSISKSAEFSEKENDGKAPNAMHWLMQNAPGKLSRSPWKEVGSQTKPYGLPTRPRFDRKKPNENGGWELGFVNHPSD